ncbi:MAG: hypothetical protein WCG85_14350 [Polyangia bacterium]
MTTSSQGVAAANSEVLSSSYEELRRTAVDPSEGTGRSVGLGLFMRSGMAAWMQTCASLVRPRESTPRPAEQPGTLCSGLRNAVAMVLAEMALSTDTQGATT